MKKSKGQLFMKLDGLKKRSEHTPSKTRTMSVLSKFVIMFKSGRLIMGLLLIIAIAGLVNENIRKQAVEPKCWFSMAGDTAEAKGIVSKIEFLALGLKNRNDYKILYTFTVNGKTYEGASFQEGLIYRKNEAIDVTYSIKDPSCSCGGGKCPAEDAMFTIIFGGLFIIIALFLVMSGMRRIFNTISIIEYGVVTTATVRKILKSQKRVWYVSFAWTRTIWVVTCEFKDSSGKTVSFEVNSSNKDFIQKGDSIAVVYDPGMPENALAVDALPFFVKTDPGLLA